VRSLLDSLVGRYTLPVNSPTAGRETPCAAQNSRRSHTIATASPPLIVGYRLPSVGKQLLYAMSIGTRAANVAIVFCVTTLAGCDFQKVRGPAARDENPQQPRTTSDATAAASGQPDQAASQQAVQSGRVGVPPLGLPEGAHFERATTTLPPTGNRVELSDCVVQRLGTGSYRASLQYLFATGQPDPAREYMVHVRFNGTPFHEAKRFAGNTLLLQGTLQWEFQLPAITGGKTLPAPGEFLMEMAEEETRDGRKGYAGRSNKFSGVTKP